MASHKPAFPISYLHAILAFPNRWIRPSQMVFVSTVVLYLSRYCGIGGPGFVNRHIGTLSIESGVREEAKTNYLWALAFHCCRDSEEGGASPNRSFETASAGRIFDDSTNCVIRSGIRTTSLTGKRAST